MDFLDDEPSPEERQAMIVQLLKAKMAGQLQPQQGPSNADFSQGWGNMNMRSGDRVLSALGQSQIQQGQQMGVRADQAKQFSLTKALEDARRKDDRQFQGEQNDLNRQVRSDEMRQRGLDRALQREMMAGTRTDAAANRQAQYDDKAVLDLSKRNEGTASIAQDLKTLIRTAQEDDIPGVGVFDGRKPDLLVGSDGIQTRQAARGLQGAIIKQRSGITVSEKELTRILGELGMGDGATEESYRLGLKRLIQQAHESGQGVEAGYRPEVVQEARRRGMTTSQDLPDYPADKAVLAQPPSPGMVRIRDPKTGRTGWAPQGAIPSGLEEVTGG
jgi:hypothetical protein